MNVSVNRNKKGSSKFNSLTNALFIKFVEAFEFTLKFTLSLLLHVSVYDHHQGAYSSLAKVILKLSKSYIVICHVVV